MNSIEGTLVRQVDEDSAIGSFEWMELDILTREMANLRARVADARSDHDYRLVEVHEQEIAALQQRHARLLAHITTTLAGHDHSPLQREMAEGADHRRHHGLPEEDRENGADPDQRSAEVFDLVIANRVAVPYANSTEGFATVWDQLAPADVEPNKMTSLVASAGSAPNPEMAEADDPRQPLDFPEEDREKIAGPDRQSAEVFDLTAATRVAVPYANSTEGVPAVWYQLTPTDIERATHELDTRRTEMLARHQDELKALNAEQSEVDTLAQAIEDFARKFNFLKSPPSVAAASLVG